MLVLSADVSLKSLMVNGFAYGGPVSVPFGVRSVDVVAVTTEPAASYAVVGNGALRTGANNVVVRVTAVNGDVQDYVVVVTVLKSSNAALVSLTVNGQDGLAGGVVVVPARTAVAVVKAVTADSGASVAVSGTALVAGQNNVVSVVVTAADGVTTNRVDVTVFVTPLSEDSSLKSLKVNDVSYVDGQVELPIGSKSVAVAAVANDAGASVEVTGNNNLVAGLNSVRVRVTAASGAFTDRLVKVFVAFRSSNADISSVAGTWLINGVDVSDAATVVELAAGRTAVSATAKTADARATIAVTGASALVPGLNKVKFTVTAEDGVTKTEYERTVRVAELSSNTDLQSLTVAEKLVANGDIVYVPAGTVRVSVVPVLASSESRFTILGNSGLISGSNLVVVTVIAPSGATVVTTINVQVAEAASNTKLSTFTINGLAVVNGSTIKLASGTNRVQISAIAEDSKASVAVTGKSGLKNGSNIVTVKVTALSGASTTYSVTVNVGN